MTRFDQTHITFLIVTFLFLAITCFLVSKMKPRWQDAMFVIAVLMCSGGIFFRYGMGLTLDGDIDFKTLTMQMLQVCNFNFLLLPLMLLPSNELGRQYSVFFSMFAASTMLISLPPSWVGMNWNDVSIINSWLNHVFAIACPLWMMAAGRLRPRRSYVLPVSLCVFLYFTIVYAISEGLIVRGLLTPANSFSFIYNSDGIPILDQFHKLIPLPYFYLYPVLPIATLFFYVFSIPFNKRVTFVANGGKGWTKRRLAVAYESVRLPSWRFKRMGYELLGFSRRPDAEVPEYRLGSRFVMGDSPTTLYAIWKEKTVENEQ